MGTRTQGNDHAVTIRIDQIKELKLDQIHSAFANGNSWVLTRKNDNEAIIEQQPLDQMAEQISQGVKAAVLKFWCADKSSTSGTNSFGSKMSMRSKKSSKSGVSFSPSTVHDVESGAEERPWFTSWSHLKNLIRV